MIEVDNAWLGDCNDYDYSKPSRQEKEERFYLWKLTKQLLLGYEITEEENFFRKQFLKKYGKIEELTIREVDNL